jgi:lysophospholipase L1-like esterase
MAKKRKKRYLANFMLLIIVFLTLFVVMEGIFQAYHITRKWFDYYNTLTIPSKNPILLYEYRPNYSIDYHGSEIKINSDGLRDREYNISKPKNTTRIAVVGDSVAFGFLVNNSDSFPKQLERILNSGHRSVNYEVMNFGTMSYGSVEEAEVIANKTLKYHPDIIIIQYALNDPIMSPNPYLSAKNIGECNIYGTSARIPCWVNSVILKSKFLTFIIGKLSDIYFSFNDYFRSLYDDKESWSNVKNSLNKISRISRENHIKVVIFMFPVFKDMKNYKWVDLDNKVLAEAKKNGIPTFDLLDEYTGYNESLLSYDSLHPTKYGHNLAAGFIKKRLAEVNTT